MTQQNLTKINTYAVETEGEKIALSKLNTYAVELTTFGDVYQTVDADRPLYRDAPTGGIPYIDMSGTGAALKVNIPVADTYTVIIYNADQTFSVSEVDFVVGENALTITEDFNQLAALKGKNLHRFTIDAVKEGMKARI